MPNVMKGKKYKICVFCGKKRAHGPWKLMKPHHGVCGSFIDNVANFGSLIEKWEKNNYTLQDIIQDGNKAYRESFSSENQ